MGGKIAVLVISLAALYASSRYSFLLFHCLAELFSIVVAFGIFIIAWNTRTIIENNYLLFLGIAYFFIGLQDLFHTLAYKGMNVFEGYGANLPTQLWISARYTEGFSLLTAPAFLNRKIRPSMVLAVYSSAALLLFISVFAGIFPDCYIEGSGLTAFKITSEYIICGVLLCALAALYKKRAEFDRTVFHTLALSILFTIGAELSFTFYVSVYGLSNMVGHIFKLVSFGLIYTALIETGISRPFRLLFRNLANSEKKYRSLFDNMLNGFAYHKIVKDGHGRPSDYVFLEVNDSFEHLTGLKRKDIIGRTVTDIVPGIEKDPADWIGTYGRVALTGEALHFENYSERLKRWFSVSAYSTQREYFAVTFEDITAQKELEDRLKKSHNELEFRVKDRTKELQWANEQLQTEMAERKRAEETAKKERQRFFDVLETLPVMICLLTPDYRVPFANRSFRETFGESRGRYCYEYCFGRSAPCEFCRTFSVFEMGQPLHWEVARPDGRVIDVYDLPFTDVDGSPMILEMNIDITERRQAENEREQLNSELFRKNAELQQILYTTSHDLRSPLVNVDGFSKELQCSIDEMVSLIEQNGFPPGIHEKMDSIIKKDIPRSLKYIHTSVAKMERLLQGILSLSRLGQHELKFEDVNINALIGDVLDTYYIKLKESGATIELSELPVCMGDSSLINRVFSNLLDNAIKYLDPGRPGVIRISGHRNNDRSVYCIEDNGIGINPDYAGKIFEIFYQLQPERVRGEGLGLTIVHRIMDMHKGKVWVESEPGKGSRFYISFPGPRASVKPE